MKFGKQTERTGALLVLWLTCTLSNAAEFIGPEPYLQVSDSPFNALRFDYFHLEDFEDGVFNTPGVSAVQDWNIRVSVYSDSVDGDDGVVDGDNTGNIGANYSSRIRYELLTLNFDASELGGSLPTHAGIVWTDIGINGGGEGPGSQPVVFSALDGQGNSLGSIGPVYLGDIPIAGETQEDRFFGVVNPGGISSITISMPGLNNWGVDHVQYGYQSLPAPHLVSPVVRSYSPTPMYQWEAVPQATWYQLWVNGDTGTPVVKWYTASAAGCATGSDCTVSLSTAVSGNVTWWVQSWNNVDGNSPWSDGVRFLSNQPASPPTVRAVWPEGDNIGSNPVYTWHASPSATWYRLWINDGGSKVHDKWYRAVEVNCGGTTAHCTIGSPVSIGGSTIWWVQPWSPDGYGAWNTGSRFTP